MLRSAALGLLLFVQLAVALSFSEQNLPLVVCFVLFSYYLWSSYSSYTTKYQDLAVTLFGHHNHLTNRPNRHKETNEKARIIPKALFSMRCEELLPIRDNTRKLVSKVVWYLIFVFLVFSLTMLLDVSPLTKALLSFLAGSVPRFMTFYFGRSKQRNAQALFMNRKVGQIVLSYVKSTPVYINRGHPNRNARVLSLVSKPEEERDMLEFGLNTSCISLGVIVAYLATNNVQYLKYIYNYIGRFLDNLAGIQGED